VISAASIQERRMANTINCGCKSDKFGNEQAAKFQDRHYGKGMRVYTDGGPTGKKMHCTVCGKERTK
jgi:hypothetical protein